MSPQPVLPDEQSAMLHPELLDHDDPDAIYRGGHRLDHAEGASKPLRGAQRNSRVAR